MVSTAPRELMNRLMLVNWEQECIFVPTFLWLENLYSCYSAWLDAASYVALNPQLVPRDVDTISYFCKWPMLLHVNFTNRGRKTWWAPGIRKELEAAGVIPKTKGAMSPLLQPIVIPFKPEFVEYLLGVGPDWRTSNVSLHSHLHNLDRHFSIPRGRFLFDKFLWQDCKAGELVLTTTAAIRAVMRPIVCFTPLEAMAMDDTPTVMVVDVHRGSYPGAQGPVPSDTKVSPWPLLRLIGW